MAVGTCPVCNATKQTEKMRYQDAAFNLPIIGTTCDHFCLIQNGDWVRLSTAASNASTGDNSSFESAHVNTTNLASAIKTAQRLMTGKR